MECFRCDQDAAFECSRCGELYCEAHGDSLCERCQDPTLALPSYRVYRGSLLALLIGSVFAVWLLVRPSGGNDLDAAERATSVLPAATAAATVTPDPDDQTAGAAPAATATPVATATPAVAATATPTPEPEPEFIEYTVAAGDTLSSIAARFLPPGEGLEAFSQRIAELNQLPDLGLVRLGETLQIPRQ